MRPISKKLLADMLTDPYYKKCSRASPDCSGRITLEHAMIFSGRQLEERWSIIPQCERHHLGDLFNKEINVWIALCRATDEDLAKYPRTDWVQRKKYLIAKYGHR